MSILRFISTFFSSSIYIFRIRLYAASTFSKLCNYVFHDISNQYSWWI